MIAPCWVNSRTFKNMRDYKYKNNFNRFFVYYSLERTQGPDTEPHTLRIAPE